MTTVEIGRGKSGRRAYPLDEIGIVPSRRTRDPEEVSVAWQIDAYRFEMPLVASPMDSVVSPAFAAQLGRLGGLAVLDLEGLWTRFADPEPILAEIAERLVRAVLADHPDEKTISLLAISVSHLEEHWDVQLELPLGLADEARRPGTRKGMARWAADRAVDRIRDRFGWDAIGYASVALERRRSVPDAFRTLAEKDL